MPIELFPHIEQNTAEWLEARKGIVTASEFANVIASGRGGAESKTRKTYLYKLAGEIITGKPAESYSNQAMARGHAMEAEARNHYAFMRDIEPIQVGFIRNGRKGYSPDAMIETDGLLEIKTKTPHILIDVLMRGEMPPEHAAQIQGGMWVAERAWCDFVAYYSGMPPFITRIWRDDAYITRLEKAVSEFNDELDEIVGKIASLSARAVEADVTTGVAVL